MVNSTPDGINGGGKAQHGIMASFAFSETTLSCSD